MEISDPGDEEGQHSGAENRTPDRRKRDLDSEGEAALATPVKQSKKSSACAPAEFGKPLQKDLKIRCPGSQSVEKADADLEIVPDDGSLGYSLEKATAIARSKHKRSCRKLVQSESMLRNAVVKKYLVYTGLTWPRFQKEHRRRSGRNYFVLFCISTE